MSTNECIAVLSTRRPGAHKALRPRGRRLVIGAMALVVSGVAMVTWSQVGAQHRAAAAARQDRAAALALRQGVDRIEASWVRGLAPGEVGVLRIPRFDDGGEKFSAPIVEGWSNADLARGIGLYVDGASPGDAGNVVLAGHRITHGSPFAAFPSLRRGDLVEVELADRVVTYRLITSGSEYRVPNSTSWPTWSTPDPALHADRPTSRHYLTLVTCAETYHTDMRNVAVGVEVGVRRVSLAAARRVGETTPAPGP